MIDYSDYPPELAYLMREIEREINALFDDLEMGRIKAFGSAIELWQSKMTTLLTRFHTAAYMVGAKVKGLIDRDITFIKNVVKTQLDFFRNLVTEMKEAVTPLWKQWRNRAVRYGEAIKTLYWKGKMMGIPTPAQIGEGTYCHCGCFWDIITIDDNKGDYDLYWKRGKKDSCSICIEREQKWNPVRVRNWELIGDFSTPFLVKEFRNVFEKELESL